MAELLNGEYLENKNKSANMKRGHFYVCPICQNVIHSMGEGAYSCCGVLLPPLVPEESDLLHEIQVGRIDDEFHVFVSHPMEKGHYISFLAYVTSERLQLVKLYPEQNAETRFRICGSGNFYAYCNKHGLFYVPAKLRN